MSVKHSFCRFLLNICQKIKRFCHRSFVETIIKRCFEKCGKHVRIAENCRFYGIENITLGDNVSLGVGTLIMTTRAKVKLGNFIMFGPNVTIITGNHRTDIIGRYMYSVADNEKRPKMIVM